MNPNELLEAIERLIRKTEEDIEKKNLLEGNDAIEARLSAYHAIRILVENNQEVEDE